MRNEIKVFFTRKLRDRFHLYRYGIILAYLILMTLMMPRAYRLNYQYEIGKKWEVAPLVAPFDFAIYKDTDSLEVERENASRQILDIYRRDTVVEEQVAQEVDNVLLSFQSAVNSFREAKANKDTLRQRQIYDAMVQLDLPPFEDDLFGSDVNTLLENMQSEARIRVNKAFQKGFIQLGQPQDSSLLYISIRIRSGLERYHAVKDLIISPKQLKDWLDGLPSTLPTKINQYLNAVLLKKIRFNLLFDQENTHLARERKKALISPVKEKISAGSTIINKGTLVTKDEAERIESLILESKRKEGEENTLLVFLSQFIIIMMITGIFFAYLWFNRPRLYFDYKKLALILFTFVIAVGAMVLATKLTNLAERLSDFSPNINLSYIYLAPACIVPIFISSFFDHRLALQANILVALFGAVLVQQGLEFAFVQICAGTVAVYSLKKLRKRDTFFITLGYILIAYCTAYIAFNLLSKGSFFEINYRTLLIFGINVILTVITYNLIYVMERVFSVTSDLTYLELLDTNYPLLQELARKAPGTFQHSLQVANIAEATIKEVGGNALLTHVGALYHDIGKMADSKYFIENMSEEDKENNPHDQINCEESAGIIIGHVKKGVEMAHKYHLPREIVDFIQMHHGTTRVEYFYRVYLKLNQCQAPEAEELFRYPGPLPNTKETAVLMISDSIEAASRSLKNPTPEKLKELVDSIINHKIKDHQLEHSNLTFRDISIIRQVIKKQLLSIYHGRISYVQEEEVA